MTKRSLLVNLDAMIGRADFSEQNNDSNVYDNIPSIAIKDLTREGLLGKTLRKPDFQRETNHWTPEQVVSLIECFIDGDLIPSVILWQSQTFLFVIDGAHRLSVLRAWVEDDYGDGPISFSYFGDAISKTQKDAATKTRAQVAEKVGTYQHFKTRIDNAQIDARVNSVIRRALAIQWVKGDADKAESSFFKINTQGTPLDNIEESLLKSRKKPIAISSRAVIRAGKGHKYWSRFQDESAEKIEKLAKQIHVLLFDPEISSPIKTLDLPLGGSKGIRTALQVLIDYFSIASSTPTNKNVKIDSADDDEDGTTTIEVLKKAHHLAQRITGNDIASLGLHPAIYFYGPTGVHSLPMFLGTCKLISEKITNNDSMFFKKLTVNRQKIETALVIHKDLIATILQKTGSNKRVNAYHSLLKSLIENIEKGDEVNQEKMIEWGNVRGRVLIGEEISGAINFSDETKSKVFIHNSLSTAIKCPICSGYLDTAKSVSYDHLLDKKHGGDGRDTNLQLTHPYCNSSKHELIKLKNASNAEK